MERKKWEETKKDCALAVFFEGTEKEENQEGENSLPALLWNYLKRTVVGDDGDPEGEERRSSRIQLTDFSWCRVKPKMGILQFKSRKKANQVYTRLMEGERASEGPIKIGDFSVEFMKLMDLPESTWNLLPEDTLQDSLSSVSQPQSSTSQGSPPVKKRKINTSSSSSSCSSIDDLTNSTGNDTKPGNSDLVTQFKIILEFAGIPSTEYQQAQQIIKQVKTLISSEYPSCQVFLFRHNFHKVLHPFCNDLLIFAHGDPISTNQVPSLQKLDISKIAKLAVVNDPTLFYIYEEDPKYKGSQQFELLSNPGGPSLRNFWIITDEAYLLEVQLNRLLEYMLTFDPKCRLLLSLLHYFCARNSCYFGGDNSPSKSETMEWLLIFFLSQKKVKVIPTVREILNQPHQPIILPNCERNIDIGFNSDPDFVNKWKIRNGGTMKIENYTEQFVHDVLKLFEKFLRFQCWVLGKGKYILNIRDCEKHIRKRVQFRPRSKLSTKWTDEEIEIVKKNLEHGGRSRKFKWPLIIVHPLVVHLNLGYDKGKFMKESKRMKQVVLQLNRFLNLNVIGQNFERWVQLRESEPEIYKDLESVLKFKIIKGFQ